jgi:hypothetical protein
MVNRGRLDWVDGTIWDTGTWETGGRTSLISRDGKFVSGFGVCGDIPSVLGGSEELQGGLSEDKRSTLGDTDRLGVVSQSIFSRVVSRVRT